MSRLSRDRRERGEAGLAARAAGTSPHLLPRPERHEHKVGVTVYPTKLVAPEMQMLDRSPVDQPALVVAENSAAHIACQNQRRSLVTQSSEAWSTSLP